MGISPVELIEHIAVFSIALVFGLRNLARAWKIFGWAAILIAILTGVEGASGVFDLATHGVSRIAHRWLDHGLMILLWWMNVAGLGLGLASIRTRPTTTIGTGILVITLFFLMMLESVMGYLPGADAFGGPAGEESRNRGSVSSTRSTRLMARPRKKRVVTSSPGDRAVASRMSWPSPVRCVRL